MYSIGTVYMYGGYYVCYSKTIQNNKKREEFKQGFANPVFYNGATF